MHARIAIRRLGQVFLLPITLVALAAALRLWPLQHLEARLAWLTFYPTVMIIALYGGLYAGLVGTLLSCLTVLFLLPVLMHQLMIRDMADWLGMSVFFATCTMLSGAAEAMLRARARARQAHEQLKSANVGLDQEVSRRPLEPAFRSCHDLVNLRPRSHTCLLFNLQSRISSLLSSSSVIPLSRLFFPIPDKTLLFRQDSGVNVLKKNLSLQKEAGPVLCR